MVVLREFEGYSLNEGYSMAKGLFNVSTDNDVSLWFDRETKDELITCTDKEFKEKCENLINLIK
jgi:hypothetical protein